MEHPECESMQGLITLAQHVNGVRCTVTAIQNAIARHRLISFQSSSSTLVPFFMQMSWGGMQYARVTMLVTQRPERD